MRLSVRQRQLLKQRVDELGGTEHHEIFRLLTRHGVPYTRNSNGVFVNLTTVPDDVVVEMQQFVDFCTSNKASLDEYDQRLSACKLTHNFSTMMLGNSGGELTTAPSASTSDAAVGVATADTDLRTVPAPAEDDARPAVPDVAVEVEVETVKADGDAHTPPPPPPVAYKKMVNTKFYLAKKKFARRKVTEPSTRSTAGGAGAGADAEDDVNVMHADEYVC